MCLKGQIGLCSGCTFIGTVKYARSVSLAPSSWTARPSLSALAHEFHSILLHCHYLIPVEGGECVWEVVVCIWMEDVMSE